MLILRQKYEPSIELQDFVESYQVYHTQPESYNYMIPEGIIEVVFQFGTNIFQKNYHHQISWEQRRVAFIGGLRNMAFQIKATNIGETFGIRFKVGGFAFFSKIPVYQFKNQLVDIQEVWGEDALSYQQQMIKANDIKTRINLTEIFLKKKYQKHKYTQFSSAALEMDNYQESFSIQKLASAFSYSPSRFRQVFKEVIGISPKEYMMIRRINQAFQKQAKISSLTALALELGYYDQAHFVHHCKKITGMRPKELFQQRLLTDTHF